MLQHNWLLRMSNLTKFYHKLDEIFEFEVFVALAVWASIFRDISRMFIYYKIYVVYSLESPRRGDSNDYNQYIIML